MTTDDEDWPRERAARAGAGSARRSLTASEAAALIGVSVATIRGWADQGRLPSHRTVGGHRRFEVEELREWLAGRGAPAPEPRRLRRPPQVVPACPLLAHELNARVEAIAARVLSGYDPAVPTPMAAPSAPAMRRLTVRFVRVIAAGLESGRPGAAAGRIELAGLRGGMEGTSGARVIAEHTRVAAAVLIEAEAARDEGAEMEPLALAALHSVIDHAQAAVARGFYQARGPRPLPGEAPPR